MSEKEEVLFEPFPKQEEFVTAALSGDFDIILYGGAIRGGKTFAGLATLIIMCKLYPNSRWIVVRNTLQTLKNTTIPSFFKLMPSNFQENYNQQQQVVRCTNGSEIKFLGENYDGDKELDRFKGLECNGFLLEEVNEIQEKTFNKCIERSGSWLIPNLNGEKQKQPRAVILATCNPTQNWVKTKFYNKWKDGKMPKRWLYIPSKIFDNPHIPPDYVEGLKNMPPFEYEVFVNGDWEIQPRTGHEFYKRFDTEKHIAPLRYNENLAIHLSLDFNVNPYISMGVFQMQRVGAKYVVKQIGEYALKSPNNTTEDLGKAFKKDYPLHVAGLFYYGDPSGKQRDTRQKGGGNDYTILHNELKDYHPQDRVLRAHPKVSSRGTFMNAIFDDKIDTIQYIIDRNCSETVKDCINLKEAPDGGKLKEKQKDPLTGITYEKVGHMSDMLEYLFCKAFEKEYKRHIGKRRKLLS